MFNKLRNLATLCIIALCGLTGIVLFNFQNLILIIYFILAIFVMFRIEGQKEDKWIVICAFLIGALADIIISNSGGWKFSNDTFNGIPPWLPFSWSWNALLFKKLGRTITTILDKN